MEWMKKASGQLEGRQRTRQARYVMVPPALLDTLLCKHVSRSEKHRCGPHSISESTGNGGARTDRRSRFELRLVDGSWVVDLVSACGSREPGGHVQGSVVSAEEGCHDLFES